MKESKAAQSALFEARMETEAIEMEKKQLMQNWSSCLIGMKRRDEAHSQMNDAIRAQRQKFDSTIAEIDSYKRSIIQEQQRNENNTILLNQRKAESHNLEKSLKINKEKMDIVQQEFSSFNKILKQTESQLSGVRAVRSF